jgi:lysophospholipid acyltransferase
VRDKINNWNISVQEWLRKAIYQRSPFKGKTANQLYVFVVSAFWHGIYSAYYISELLWFVQLHLQALMFKYFNKNTTFINKLYEKSGLIGHVLLAVVVSFVFTHNATYFLILEGEYCWKFMTRMYFIPEGAMLLLIAIFTLLPRKKEGKGKEKERLTAKVE